MPSNRRLRAMLVLALTFLVVMLYFTSSARRAGSQDFSERTVAKLDAKNAEDRHAQQLLSDRVKAAAEEKDKLAATGDDVRADDEEKINRTKMLGVAQGGKDDSKLDKDPPATKEEHEIEVELNDILKKSPIIIFSKSYCRFSKKAKSILLGKYKIVPAPYVVELDEHRLGPGLQAALEKSTGRGTVPNVLINGKSIGGGDDVEKLHLDGTLIEKVTSMGGKRIMEAKAT